MKVTSKGFEITEVCPKINSLVFDCDGLRIDEGPGAHSLGLTADDVLKLIEALTEAHRLMTATTPSALGPAPRLEDRDGDIWTLDPDGETYNFDGLHHSRERVEREWGPVTELRD